MDIYNKNSVDPMFQVTIPEKAPKQSNWLGRIVKQTSASLTTLVGRVGGAFDKNPSQEVSDPKSPSLTEAVKSQPSRENHERRESITSAESFDLGVNFSRSLSSPSVVSSEPKTSSEDLSFDSALPSREEASPINKRKAVGTDVAVFEDGDFDIISIYEEEAIPEEEEMDPLLYEFYENLNADVVTDLYNGK